MSLFTVVSKPRKKIDVEVEKHADHDQSTHGNWADGSRSENNVDEIVDMIFGGLGRVGETPRNQPEPPKDPKEWFGRAQETWRKLSDWRTGAYSKYTSLLPLDVAWQYREFDRVKQGQFEGYLDFLADDIKKNGLQSALIMEYHPATQKALITEGNHRLAAAQKLGIESVPVRVYVRRTPFGTNPQGRPAQRVSTVEAVKLRVDIEGGMHPPQDLSPAALGLETVVEKHATHNQKDHGNRYGAIGSQVREGSIITWKSLGKTQRIHIWNVLQKPSGDEGYLRVKGQRLKRDGSVYSADWDDLFEVSIGTWAIESVENETEVEKHAQGQHDQKDHGNWSRGLSARQIATSIDEPDEGFTRHYPSGTEPTTGFAVALPGHEAVIELDRVTEGWVRQYRKQHAEALGREDTNWGGWVEYNEQTGQYEAYLDVSVVTDTLEAAQQIGYESNQLAVYDIEAGETIYLEEQQQRWFQDTPSHDYDAGWDYEIDETPDGPVVEAVSQVSEQIKNNFGGFKTQYVRGLADDHLGRFASGTGSHPVVVLDAAAIAQAAESYGVPLDVAVRTTIVHELGHAIQELKGKEYSEEDAEAVAADYERKQR